MRFLIRLAIIGMWAFGGLSVVSADSADVRLTEKEAYILLDNLLGLSAVGNDKSADLQRYKRWADLHDKLMEQNQLNLAQMKVYLLIVFIAEEKTKVHSMEEIAEEIIPLFKRQPTVMLQAMKELPFLLPRACSQFSAHFELFGSGRDKQQFLTSYEKMITDKLGKEHATVCLTQIRAS